MTAQIAIVTDIPDAVNKWSQIWECKLKHWGHKYQK